jgi:hypothetical protein
MKSEKSVKYSDISIKYLEWFATFLKKVLACTNILENEGIFLQFTQNQVVVAYGSNVVIGTALM